MLYFSLRIVKFDFQELIIKKRRRRSMATFLATKSHTKVAATMGHNMTKNMEEDTRRITRKALIGQSNTRKR